MEDILKELAKPFRPEFITWKPGAMSKGEPPKALAMAYADLRAYQERLDEVCGLNWAVNYTPWGDDRIVCHLTINGITRSSTGESSKDSEKNEIGGTSAEAQAMKRACAMFGLGRYLYNLDSQWVEYDTQKRKFTPAAEAKLASIIKQHYQRFMGKVEPVLERATSVSPAKEASLLDQLDELGKSIYNGRWEEVSRANAAKLTKGRTENINELTIPEIEKYIDGLNKVKASAPKA